MRGAGATPLADSWWYSVEGQAQEIRARGCNGFLQKPFAAATLSAKLQELL